MNQLIMDDCKLKAWLMRTLFTSFMLFLQMGLHNWNIPKQLWIRAKFMMFSTMVPREMLVTLNLYSHCDER